MDVNGHKAQQHDNDLEYISPDHSFYSTLYRDERRQKQSVRQMFALVTLIPLCTELKLNTKPETRCQLNVCVLISDLSLLLCVRYTVTTFGFYSQRSLRSKDIYHEKKHPPKPK